MGLLQPWDWYVIGGYFLLVIGVVIWVMKQRQRTSADFFLAGRSLGWFLVGASIFASNIGSEHLVGLAGSGVTDGVAMAHYELHAWCLLVLGWVMIPFYMRAKIFTMPEFLERRFSPTCRTVLSVISLASYVLTKIAVGIFAGGVVFSALMPELNILGFDSFWIGSVLVIVFTGIYTTLGGMKAVVYTETLQVFILILGSLLVTIFGLKAIGGWSELRAICGPEMFNLWKPMVPHGMEATWMPVKEAGRMAWYFNDNYPWLGMLFCAPVIGLWYWCTSQCIVQRVLGAHNEREARRGAIAAAFLKLLPVFIFIIPGMICYALGKSGKIPSIQHTMFDGAGQLIRAKAQSAYPTLVVTILPVGVRGIVVAALLSALMSSLAGVFNACSTLFTMDFYARFNPRASQAHLVWVGRVATAVLVITGFLWIPVIRGGKGLYDYLQGVQAYLAPPIFVVFFLGVFWKRLNAKGCLAALTAGFGLGLFRLAIDTPVKLIEGFSFQTGSVLWIMNNIFFQYFSILILIVCAVVMIVVSYLTEAPSYQAISGFTYGTTTAQHRKHSRGTWTKADVISSVIVLAMIIGAYLYFTG